MIYTILNEERFYTNNIKHNNTENTVELYQYI